MSKKVLRWICQPRVWPALIRTGFAWAGLILSSFVVSPVFLLSIYIFVGWFSRGPSLEELFGIFLLSLGLLALPTLGVTYWMTRLEQRPLASLGLHTSCHSFAEFFQGVLLGIAWPSCGLLVLYWSGALHISWNPIALGPSLTIWVFVLGLGWFGVAFWEELFFRGYMLQTLASGIGIVPAMLVTSLAFGIIHFVTYGVKVLVLFNLVLGGLVLSVLYLKTKSLWTPIGMHLATNFLNAHVFSTSIEEEMNLPFLKSDGQLIRAQAPELFFQIDFAKGGGALEWLATLEGVLFSLISTALIILLIWKLPWFRPHPEMEALWQQYVPIAQPWAQLKNWWNNRKQAAHDQTPPAS